MLVGCVPPITRLAHPLISLFICDVVAHGLRTTSNRSRLLAIFFIYLAAHPCRGPHLLGASGRSRISLFIYQTLCYSVRPPAVERNAWPFISLLIQQTNSSSAQVLCHPQYAWISLFICGATVHETRAANHPLSGTNNFFIYLADECSGAAHHHSPVLLIR